eukprot:gene299-172_t
MYCYSCSVLPGEVTRTLYDDDLRIRCHSSLLFNLLIFLLSFSYSLKRVLYINSQSINIPFTTLLPHPIHLLAGFVIILKERSFLFIQTTGLLSLRKNCAHRSYVPNIYSWIMPFFDRDCVTLTLQVPNLVFPGCQFQGQLVVVLSKAVKCSGIEVELTGIEQCMQRMKHRPATLRNLRGVGPSFLHFKRTVKLMGNEHRDPTVLQPGTFTFPVSIEVPPTAPPSYALWMGQSCAALEYSAGVKFDIPMGFDAEISVPFTVGSGIPRSLYDRRRGGEVARRSASCSVAPDGCSCFGNDDAGHIDVLVEVMQTALCLPLAGSFNVPPPPPPPPGFSPCGLQPVSPSTVVVRVQLHNCAPMSDIRLVRLQILQSSCLLRTDDGRRRDTRCLASAQYVPPAGRIALHESTTFEVPLAVMQHMASDLSDAASMLPIPTLCTPMVSNSLSVSIDFPGVELETPFILQDIIVAGSAVDSANRGKACVTFSEVKGGFIFCSLYLVSFSLPDFCCAYKQQYKNELQNGDAYFDSDGDIPYFWARHKEKDKIVSVEKADSFNIQNSSTDCYLLLLPFALPLARMSRTMDSGDTKYHTVLCDLAPSPSYLNIPKRVQVGTPVGSHLNSSFLSRAFFILVSLCYRPLAATSEREGVSAYLFMKRAYRLEIEATEETKKNKIVWDIIIPSLNLSLVDSVAVAGDMPDYYLDGYVAVLSRIKEPPEG